MKKLTCILAVATVFAGVAIAGCSGDEEDKNIKDPKEFCTKFGTAMGTKLLTCAGNVAPEAVAQQMAARALDPSNECNQFAQLVAKGTVKYDSAKSGACIEAVEKRACDLVINDMANDVDFPAECAGVIAGTKAVDGECYDDIECVDGAECEGESDLSSSSASQCKAGKCVARVALNGDCSGGKECVDGLECVSNVCKAAPAANEPCGYGTGFSSCKDVYNNYCNAANYGVAGTCAARKDLGAECSGSGYGDDDCKYELVCRPEDPANPQAKKTCQAAGLKLNAACTTAGAVNCLSGLYCDEVCKLGAGPNQPCGIVNGRQIPCTVGKCEQENPLGAGVCKVEIPEFLKSGETCPDQSTTTTTGMRKICEPGLYCIQATGATTATCAACPP